MAGKKNIGDHEELLRREIMEGCGCGGDDDGGNVELSLRLGSARPPAAAALEEGRKSITIFYNGRMCAADVTELQARAIICMATRGMEQNNEDCNKINVAKCCDHRQVQILPASPRGGLAAPPPPLLNSGLSMKRSLQRFLQKRKTRIAAVSPYANRPHRSLKSSLMS